MQNNYQSFLLATEEFHAVLKQKRDELESLLLTYEPHGTFIDEYERTLDALANVEDELSTIKSGVQDLKMATFFPLNLPLYSLLLFAVMPSMFAAKVYVRSSVVTQPILQKLVSLLELERIFPNIIIMQTSRSLFLNLYAKNADVIIFTGRYENALKIQHECPQALLVYNGSGINPAIVFRNANVEEAVEKVFEMRTFNSGQDCAGTDAIFVPREMVDEVVLMLKNKIAKAKVGNYGERSVHIGPVQKEDYVATVTDVLQIEAKNLVYGGKIDIENLIVHPTIIVKDIADHNGGFHEFFAPVFYILTYEDENEVERVLTNPSVVEYTMYVSYFGDHSMVNKLTAATLLRNAIVNDIEEGNLEYGGYGEKANFLAFGEQRVARPILISRDIDNFYARDGLPV